MITMKNVRVNYPSFTLDVSLNLKPGQITGIVGENGAGKSTTFKALLGLVKIDKGQCELFGKQVQDCNSKERRKFGVAMPESFYNTMYTIKEIMTMQKAFYPDFDGKTFTELCRKNDIPLDQDMKEFSTGMKAKVKVICAITHNAQVLLLDEPTAGLDISARRQIQELLQDYMEAEDDRSILISSHISTDLEALCDDLYFIHKGRIILHEDTDRLLDYYGILNVSPEQYENLDKSYFIKVSRQKYSYKILTNERSFYVENNPDIVIEKPAIDEITLMMMGAENL